MFWLWWIGIFFLVLLIVALIFGALVVAAGLAIVFFWLLLLVGLVSSIEMYHHSVPEIKGQLAVLMERTSAGNGSNASTSTSGGRKEGGAGTGSAPTTSGGSTEK